MVFKLFMRCYFSILLAPIITVSAVAGTPIIHQQSAHSIYFGGDILTMTGDQPEYAESLVVTDGKIVFVGDKEPAMQYADSNTQLVEGDGHGAGHDDDVRTRLRVAHLRPSRELTEPGTAARRGLSIDL